MSKFHCVTLKWLINHQAVREHGKQRTINCVLEEITFLTSKFTGATLTRRGKKAPCVLSVLGTICLHLLCPQKSLSFLHSLIFSLAAGRPAFSLIMQKVQTFSALWNEAPTAASASDEGPWHKQAYAIQTWFIC